jgi:hypothetical protein
VQIGRVVVQDAAGAAVVLAAAWQRGIGEQRTL